MRQIGKGFAGAFKLCSTLNLPRLTKTAYKNQDAKLLKVVQEVSEESMIKAATEIVDKNEIYYLILKSQVHMDVRLTPERYVIQAVEPVVLPLLQGAHSNFRPHDELLAA
ncbi:hypothetical protein TNCV_807401 [Trichonephila clavipes]|nr:hypothetical protein TNCV_807401 [Trichonephila clavipes]